MPLKRCVEAYGNGTLGPGMAVWCRQEAGQEAGQGAGQGAGPSHRADKGAAPGSSRVDGRPGRPAACVVVFIGINPIVTLAKQLLNMNVKLV